MKDLLKYDKEIGDDGAKVSAKLGVEESNLAVNISASIPLAVVIEPATKALDGLLAKLEAAIPGEWDKPLIESLKIKYKEELVKLLAE